MITESRFILQTKEVEGMERQIYILLSRSTTLLSRVIHHFTGGDYTHVSIGLEGPAGAFYSFGRLIPKRPFPGGLVREQVGDGFFLAFPHTLCCLYTMVVSEETYQNLKRQIAIMYAKRSEYRYSLLGVVACYFHIALSRRRHYFCSQFVAELLEESGAAALPNEPALTRPMDFQTLERLQLVHCGEVWALGQKGLTGVGKEN